MIFIAAFFGCVAKSEGDGAKAYVEATFCGAVLVWGGEETSPEPDELDQVWRLPDLDNELKQAAANFAQQYVVVTTAGELALKVPQIGQFRFHAGSRSYLQAAIE